MIEKLKRLDETLKAIEILACGLSGRPMSERRYCWPIIRELIYTYVGWGRDREPIMEGTSTDPILYSSEAWIDFKDHCQRIVFEHQEPQQGAGNKRVSGWVYVFHLPRTPFFKIGKSINVDQRVATFNITMPTELRTICKIASNDHSRLEKELHHKFWKARAKGEWFELSDQDTYHLISIAKEGVFYNG